MKYRNMALFIALLTPLCGNAGDGGIENDTKTMVKITFKDLSSRKEYSISLGEGIENTTVGFLKKALAATTQKKIIL